MFSIFVFGDLVQRLTPECSIDYIDPCSSTKPNHLLISSLYTVVSEAFQLQARILCLGGYPESRNLDAVTDRTERPAFRNQCVCVCAAFS